MKKFLSILGALSITASSVSVVIACGDNETRASLSKTVNSKIKDTDLTDLKDDSLETIKQAIEKFIPDLFEDPKITIGVDLNEGVILLTSKDSEKYRNETAKIKFTMVKQNLSLKVSDLLLPLTNDENADKKAINEVIADFYPDIFNDSKISKTIDYVNKKIVYTAKDSFKFLDETVTVKIIKEDLNDVKSTAIQHAKSMIIADQFGLDEKAIRENEYSSFRDEVNFNKYFDTTKNIKAGGTIGSSAGIWKDIIPDDTNIDSSLIPEMIRNILKIDGSTKITSDVIINMIQNNLETILISIQPLISSIGNILNLISMVPGTIKGISSSISKISDDITKFINEKLTKETVMPIVEGIQKGTDASIFDGKVYVRDLQSAIVLGVINAIGFAIDPKYQKINIGEVLAKTNTDYVLDEPAAKLNNWIKNGEINKFSFTSELFNQNIGNILESFLISINALNIMLSVYRTEEYRFESTFNYERIIDLVEGTDADKANGIFARIFTRSFVKEIDEETYNKLLSGKENLLTLDISIKDGNSSSFEDMGIIRGIVNANIDEKAEGIFGVAHTKFGQKVNLDEFDYNVISQTIQSDVSIDFIFFDPDTYGAKSTINGEKVIHFKHSFFSGKTVKTAIIDDKNNEIIFNTYKVVANNAEHLSDEQFNNLQEQHIDIVNADLKPSETIRIPFKETTGSNSINNASVQSQVDIKDGSHLFSKVKTNDEYVNYIDNLKVADFDTIVKDNEGNVQEAVHVNLKGFNLGEIIANIQYYLNGSEDNLRKFFYILTNNGAKPSKLVKFGITLLIEYTNLVELANDGKTGDDAQYNKDVLLNVIATLVHYPLSGLTNNTSLNLVKDSKKTDEGDSVNSNQKVLLEDSYWGIVQNILINKEVLSNDQLTELTNKLEEIQNFFGQNSFTTLFSGDLKPLMSTISSISFIPEGKLDPVTKWIDDKFADKKLNLSVFINDFTLRDFLDWANVLPVNEKWNNKNIPTLHSTYDYYLDKTINQLAKELGETFDVKLDAKSSDLKYHYLDFNVLPELVEELLYGIKGEKSLITKILETLKDSNEEGNITKILNLLGINVRGLDVSIKVDSWMSKFIQLIKPNVVELFKDKNGNSKTEFTVQELLGLNKFDILTWILSGALKMFKNFIAEDDISPFMKQLVANKNIFSETNPTNKPEAFDLNQFLQNDDANNFTFTVYFNPNEIKFEDGTRLSGPVTKYVFQASRDKVGQKYVITSFEKTDLV